MQVDEPKTDGHGDAARGGESSKITFTPEQQAKVQEIVDDAVRRTHVKAAKTKAPTEEVERLKGEVDRLRDEGRRRVILEAVARHNVVDPADVAELLRGRVRMEDDGSISVTGETGGVVINNSGSPMSVDEYVGHWLSERPHHLRAAGNKGAGSASARFGETGARAYNAADPRAWREMPREELDRRLREGIKVPGASGQTYHFRDVKNPFLDARRKKTAANG
ncbi:MAG: hypothetical protein HY894_07875 [Deltaproteobacteria bacterium]|nr:hypothetical protein [Deltaproteobacteria bacterium]